MKLKQALLFGLILPMLLCGCQKRIYLDTVGCERLSQAALSALPQTQKFEEYGELQRSLILSDTCKSAQCRLLYSLPSENIDELGILHAGNDEEAREIYRRTEAYLTDLQENQSAFIASYAPEELPKLEEAEARRMGRYVIYAILSEEDKRAAFSAIEALLTP